MPFLTGADSPVARAGESISGLLELFASREWNAEEAMAAPTVGSHGLQVLTAYL